MCVKCTHTEILKIVFLENEKSRIKKVLLVIFLFSHVRIYVCIVESLFKFDFFNFDISTYILPQTLMFLLHHNMS